VCRPPLYGDSRPQESMTPRKKTVTVLIGLLLILTAFPIGASAQDPQSTTPTQSETEAQEKKDEKQKEKEKKKHDALAGIVVAPLPISSPAIGTGIVPVLGYIFTISKNDKISPPSVVGAAGLFTNNGSRGFALVGDLYFKENKYRIKAGFVRGNVNYNIYGTGIAENLRLPLKQTGEAFLAEFLRRLVWDFFLGPRFIRGNSIITVRPNTEPTFPIPPEAGLHTTLTAVGAELTRDTSVNRFYPTGGTFFSFTSDFFSEAIGSKYSFQSYKATFDKYWSLDKKQVLAYNAFFAGPAELLLSTGTASTVPTTNCEDT
jgi:hypothetical protein